MVILALLSFYNPVCPEQLASGVPGVAAFDNDDFKEDTRDGKKSSARRFYLKMQSNLLKILNRSILHQLIVMK